MTYRTPADMNYRKVEFAYNQDGLRVESKTTVIDGGEEQVETRRYTLHGKNIVHLHCSFNEYEMYQMHFFYDAQGRASIVEYNEGYSTAKYAYIHNLQGDVIGLVDENGNEVVRYTYDAWGKLLNTTGELAYTLGFYNPFRYRGYVYDEETGLYYLRSRYYSSDKGRFLNADKNILHSNTIISHNIFAYCSNSPVIFEDQDGAWFFVAVLSTCLAGIICVDSTIANMSGFNEVEKKVARNHPVQALIAKNHAKKASDLTDDYWGNGATNYDATKANAFKHAIWNALMTRDLGYQMAFSFGTAHEYGLYNNHTKYVMTYDENEVTTLHRATEMDLVNNERGRVVGMSVPFYYSDEQVANAVLRDMSMNPNQYDVIVTKYFHTPMIGR